MVHPDKEAERMIGVIIAVLFAALVYFILCFGASMAVKRLQARYSPASR